MSVAILIPCYNAAKYLPDLFEGIAAQVVPFDEILCYDDASSDDTAAIACSLGATVIRGETNHGAAFARNRLIDRTTSDWAHFHDADDLIHPEFLVRMTAAARPGTVLLAGMRVEDRTSRRLLGRVSYRDLRDATDPVGYFIEHTGYPSLGFYPLDALRKIGGFRQDLRGDEDPDLHVRLAAAGIPFDVVDADLATNLMHSGSFSAQSRVRCLQDRLRCLESYAEMGRERWPVVGNQALKIAWLLFEHGDHKTSAAAVALADKCGIRTVDSHRATARLLSRTLGPNVFFELRKWLWTALRRFPASNTAPGATET